MPSLGYLYLLLALLSAAGLGIAHKLADLRKCRPAAVNVTLFLTASLLLWGYTLFFKVMGQSADLFPPFHAKAVVVAVICGTFASFGILTFQIGVRYGRITTSWLVVNLSTLLPALLSLIVYREWQNLRWQHPVTLLLVILSIVLLWRDRVMEERRAQSPPRTQPADAPAPLVTAREER